MRIIVDQRLTGHTEVRDELSGSRVIVGVEELRGASDSIRKEVGEPLELHFFVGLVVRGLGRVLNPESRKREQEICT